MIGAARAAPADILRQLLSASGKTQADLATALDVSLLSVNQLLNGRRSVTAPMALRLSRAIAGTTPDFWLRLQMAADLVDARHALGDMSGVSVLIEEGAVEELAAAE